MPTVLLATESVHTTAAACDYLDGRLGADDEVVVLTVRTDTVSERDAGDAANVARTRLFEPTIEVIQRSAADTPDSLASTIRETARESGVDELIVGSVRGDPAAAGDPPGSTVRALLATSDRPVTVLPP